LAGTGRWDGLTATTPWILAEELAPRFRSVRVDSDRLIIDHGQILTAGGMMAWADLGLTLVSRLLGPAAMVETARFMMIDPPGREQRFYSPFSPKLSHGDGAVLKVQEHLRQSTSAGLSVVAMAALAGLEERTFVRRFRKATGLKPTDYQQHLRVDRARAMLESSATPIDAIAWNVGYSDPAAFRRGSVRGTGLAPGDYPTRFAPEDRPAAQLRGAAAAGTPQPRCGSASLPAPRLAALLQWRPLGQLGNTTFGKQTHRRIVLY